MSEEQAKNGPAKDLLDAIPHDGWKSRKFIVGVAGFVVVESLASVAMFVDRMSPETWVALNQWAWPFTIAILFGASVAEKFAYVRRS